MKEIRYTFNFKGGPVVVWAFNEREARTLAMAEAIRRGWDNTIIETTGKAKSEDTNFNLIDQALMSVIEMTDTDTVDEQLDCIDALRKLRNAYKQKHKEATK